MDRGLMVSAMVSNGKEKFEMWARSSTWVPRLGIAAAALDALHLGVGVVALLSGDPDAPGLLELMSGGGGLASGILAQFGDRSGTDRGEDQQTAAPQIAAQLPASAEQDAGACSNNSPHDETTT